MFVVPFFVLICSSSSIFQLQMMTLMMIVTMMMLVTVILPVLHLCLLGSMRPRDICATHRAETAARDEKTDRDSSPESTGNHPPASVRPHAAAAAAAVRLIRIKQR